MSEYNFSVEEINDFLNENPQWVQSGNQIVRELVASNFVSAIGVVNSIAILSEKYNHHPDIYIYGWNKIRITLTTHSNGNITDIDLLLAKEIEKIKFNEL